MIFSIKVELKFFAAERVKREDGKEQNGGPDINSIKHNFPNTQRGHDERDNAIIFTLG